MITLDTLNLELERNADGSLLWRDYEGKPVDDYFDYACASATAMSTAGRFRTMIPIPPAEKENINKITGVITGAALHLANNPKLIAHGVDPRYTRFMEEYARAHK